jgi:hypothetical protein
VPAQLRQAGISGHPVQNAFLKSHIFTSAARKHPARPTKRGVFFLACELL